jgi:hypothetical protein
MFCIVVLLPCLKVFVMLLFVGCASEKKSKGEGDSRLPNMISASER